MPPEVAQAPIVTRKRDAARTCWMRCASSAVVIDPSTSDRSYGPGSTWLDASVNDAMCSDPAMASNSSSQLSSVSWQPSQEANFHTASVGSACASTSHLPDGEPAGKRLVAEDRAVAADQE